MKLGKILVNIPNELEDIELLGVTDDSRKVTRVCVRVC